MNELYWDRAYNDRVIRDMKDIKRLIDSSYDNLCNSILEMMKLEKNFKDHNMLETHNVTNELFEIRQRLQCIRVDFQKFCEKRLDQKLF